MLHKTEMRFGDQRNWTEHERKKNQINKMKWKKNEEEVTE